MTISPWERFPARTVADLFEAVEIDDVVDPAVALPAPIVLDCTEREMQRCFALCLQFWEEGVRRDELIRLIGLLLRDGDLSPAERLRYKHIRARCKHLRFALTLYDARHRIPRLFSAQVAIMGHLQDAFRNGDRRLVKFYALLLRMLIAKPLWAWIRGRLGAIRFDSAEGFRAYRSSEIHKLGEMLGRQTLTGHQFHTMRKIVSRHVSFYDTRRSLAHNEHDYRMSRFLSAINGLMGNRHDEMVEQASTGQQAYRTAATIDPDIRLRLEKLVGHYPCI